MYIKICVIEHTGGSSLIKALTSTENRVPLSPLNKEVTSPCSVAVRRITPTKRRALTFSPQLARKGNSVHSSDATSSCVKALDFNCNGSNANGDLSPSKRGKFINAKDKPEPIVHSPAISVSLTAKSAVVQSSKPRLVRRLYEDASVRKENVSTSKYINNHFVEEEYFLSRILFGKVYL